MENCDITAIEKFVAAAFNIPFQNCMCLARTADVRSNCNVITSTGLRIFHLPPIITIDKNHFNMCLNCDGLSMYIYTACRLYGNEVEQQV